MVFPFFCLEWGLLLLIVLLVVHCGCCYLHCRGGSTDEKNGAFIRDSGFLCHLGVCLSVCLSVCLCICLHANKGVQTHRHTQRGHFVVQIHPNNFLFGWRNNPFPFFLFYTMASLSHQIFFLLKKTRTTKTTQETSVCKNNNNNNIRWNEHEHLVYTTNNWTQKSIYDNSVYKRMSG